MALDRRSLLLAVGALAACGAPSSEPAPPEAGSGAGLDVIATTAIIADAALAALGDLGAVATLMGPGVDPHAYRQTRTDVARLARADLVLYNGLYLEAQLEPLLLDLARRGAVTAVAEAVPVAERLADEAVPGRFDPHLWHDPVLWRRVIDEIGAAIAAARPEAAAEIATRTSGYRAEVERVHAYAEDVLATVPEPARVLVTAHDAFGYFARRYGFRVLGVQGLSTEAEAGLSRIRDLVEALVAEAIPAVFVETSVSERNVRALIDGAAARGHAVALGGALFSDAMGPPGTYEATYVGMMDHNVTTIATALGGRAPARGLAGRLGA